MTPQNNIRRFASADDLQRGAAEIIVRILDDTIAFRGVASLSLSGGSTPKAIYELLAHGEFRSSVEWTKVHVFWGDERCVPPSHPESNYRMACESMLDTVRIPKSNIHRIPAEKTPDQAAESYERELKSFFGNTSLPRFDLMLLGMGDDGHTASLFPGTSILDEHTRLVANVFVAKLKVHRVSLTYPVINNSESILILVSGSGKAAMLRDVIAGHPDRYPIQRVDPTHGSLLWLVDEDAASRLNTI